MKCVDYDCAFQLELCEKFSKENSEKKTGNVKKETTNRLPKKLKQGAPTSCAPSKGKKRKRLDMGVKSEGDDVFEVLDSEDEVLQKMHSRGTRSHPPFMLTSHDLSC